jgi:glutaredoxin
VIVIYGTSNCSYCSKAKELAERMQLKYEYRDLLDPSVMEELGSQLPSFKTVPQIFWNDRHIGGYSEFALEIENTIGGYGDGKI